MSKRLHSDDSNKASLYSKLTKGTKPQEKKYQNDLTTSWGFKENHNSSYPTSYPPVSKSSSSYTSHEPQSRKKMGLSKKNVDLKPDNISKSTDDEVLPSGISLSEAQHRVLQIILQRKSIFFTGAAGTGKSFILKVLSGIFGELNLTDTFALTAPTGVAACNIRGLTIHSWAGINTLIISFI
jgi:ATP-dependent DNA helicase PIF1